MNNCSQKNPPSFEQAFNQKPKQVLIQNTQHNNGRYLLSNKRLLQTQDSQLITVPIKEYSNKFLRQKKKQEIEGNSKQKEPFLNCHLQNNRKLISQFKKCKGQSQKFKKSLNKENGDFIIHNLLFDKTENLIGAKPNSILRKTIFGSLTENYNGQCNNYQLSSEESNLFQKGWKTVKNQNGFQTKKQVYEKICQKQKSLCPEYRKKCKTLNEVSYFKNIDEKQRKIQKISTSRALEKYSKIIKINPEHGKIQKMKIKKQLAKSLRLQSSEKNDFQTKQVHLFRKQNLTKNKQALIVHHLSKRHPTDLTNKQNQNILDFDKQPQRLKTSHSRQNLKAKKMGLFSSGVKFKKLRKFSHQVQSYKKCVTEEKSMDRRDSEAVEDFEINGWDINF